MASRGPHRRHTGIRRLACCAPITEAPLTDDEAAELGGIFAALSDPVRLRLLSIVATEGEVCSCNLEGPLAKSQPTISHHTRILAEAGLIRARNGGAGRGGGSSPPRWSGCGPLSGGEGFSRRRTRSLRRGRPRAMHGRPPRHTPVRSWGGDWRPPGTVRWRQSSRRCPVHPAIRSGPAVVPRGGRRDSRVVGRDVAGSSAVTAHHGLARLSRIHPDSAAGPFRRRSPGEQLDRGLSVRTPSLRRMAETWLRTVVGETKRRSEISAVDAPLRISSSTSHSRPVSRAAGPFGDGDAAVLAIAELLDEACDEASREGRLAVEHPVQRRPRCCPRPCPSAGSPTRPPAGRRTGPRPVGTR